MINELEEMLTLKEVKRVLGLSYGIIIEKVREGQLKAYKVTGHPISREELTGATYGLRVQPSDLREYIRQAQVK